MTFLNGCGRDLGRRHWWGKTLQLQVLLLLLFVGKQFQAIFLSITYEFEDKNICPSETFLVAFLMS